MMNRNLLLKRRVFQYLAVLLLFFLAPILGAQVSGARFIQRLAWVGDRNTLRYEILIEKEEERSYRMVRQEFTDALFIEISLPPGNYRCCVIPYDFLDRPGERSEWIAFEILGIVEKEQPGPEIIIVEFEPEPELEPEEPEPETVVQAKVSRHFAVYLIMAWTPMFPIYNGEDEPYGWNDSLYGEGIRLGIVSSEQRPINLGMELGVSRYYFDTGLHWYATEAQHLGIIEFNLLAQKWLFKRAIALNLRVGEGLSLLQEETTSLYVNIGSSFLFWPGETVFLEFGLDYTHFFDWGAYGAIRSWLGMGFRF